MFYRTAHAIDWCPVPFVPAQGSVLRQLAQPPPDWFEHIKWEGVSVVDNVQILARQDGIFMFRVEFKIARRHHLNRDDTVAVSQVLKSRLLGHAHVFHRPEQHAGRTRDSHRPVLVESLAPAPADTSEPADFGQGEEVTAAELMRRVISDDTRLSRLRALDSNAAVSEQRALAKLQSFHAARRDVLVTTLDLSSMNDTQARRTAAYTKHFIVAAITVFLPLLILCSAFATADKSPLQILAMTSLLTVLLSLVYAMLQRAWWHYLPRRVALWNGVGYLSVCGIYSDIVSNIEKRATAPAAREGVLDAFRWTPQTLLPLLHLDADRMSLDLQCVALLVGALAAIGALLALL